MSEIVRNWHLKLFSFCKLQHSFLLWDLNVSATKKFLQKAHKIYYSSTNETLSDHPYNTRFSKTNLSVPFFGTTAGQRTTHYRESVQWNGLKAELKDLCSPGAFWAAVRRCLLAWELWCFHLTWLLTTGPALSLALLQCIFRPHLYLLRMTIFFFSCFLLLNC